MASNNRLLDRLVMNAACAVAKSREDMLALCDTKVDIVLMGSMTVEPRDPNPAPNWYDGGLFGLNSFGLPNPGIKANAQFIPEVLELAHQKGKEFMISVAGFSVEEYRALAEFADEMKVDYLELNLSCPNTDHGKIVSFDPELVGEIVKVVLDVTSSVKVTVKVSPYTDPNLLKIVADKLALLHQEYDRLVGVVTMNTIPNALVLDKGKSVIGAGLAGMSGKAVMPFALGQVFQFRQLLPDTMAVIGVGGIETYEDLNQYFEAGASSVQAATLIVRDGHQAINELCQK
ncbi:dihydroorotate dehydrogenase [Candidatus Saccharibacteria bacterium]|nr:dihydroorotate dehydrogenase [Candidatus Saccharibacteria bacterium]MCB9834441.1 dihydroorotate dehydrogenase [Candidatus Nomurabacteria bacterium]